MSEVMGRESCGAPGMMHKARNCTDDGCAVSGTCSYRIAQKGSVSVVETARKMGLLKPAGFIEAPAPAHVTDFSGTIDGGGYKASMDDPTKLPLWLIPASFIRAVAAVLQYGKKKYAANNWRKGMAWSEVYSALLRHLTAWQDGEEKDSESGLHHLWHAACCLAFLIEYTTFSKLYGRFDDRFKRPEAE